MKVFQRVCQKIHTLVRHIVWNWTWITTTEKKSSSFFPQKSKNNFEIFVPTCFSRSKCECGLNDCQNSPEIHFLSLLSQTHVDDTECLFTYTHTYGWERRERDKQERKRYESDGLHGEQQYLLGNHVLVKCQSDKIQPDFSRNIQEMCVGGGVKSK